MAFLLLLIASRLSGVQAAEISVSAKGGAAAIEKARDQLRASGGTILLRSGDYYVPRSIVFDARDSAGLTVRAEAGVRLLFGERLTKWRPVMDSAIRSRLTPEARKHVRVATVPGFGGFAARGFGRNHLPSHPEIFSDGRRMTVARWPNEGFVRMGEPADSEPRDDGRKIGRLPLGFRYTDGQPCLKNSIRPVGTISIPRPSTFGLRRTRGKPKC
ncbi:MAG: hypothetical protein JNL98_15890 [Bryobacterales bacterium]|nr:hypothetical protein [Bryobacterales bacterium]